MKFLVRLAIATGLFMVAVTIAVIIAFAWSECLKLLSSAITPLTVLLSAALLFLYWGCWKCVSVKRDVDVAIEIQQVKKDDKYTFSPEEMETFRKLFPNGVPELTDEDKQNIEHVMNVMRAWDKGRLSDLLS